MRPALNEPLLFVLIRVIRGLFLFIIELIECNE
jgi:hypothetical protein